ncbi:MAG TPA: DNA polymerase Y family protein [Geminicoccaceae bacterium]|nr:DNA polymerase Y family protein [Geminicoccus sp.]HMU52303.1 DNA polymerase Y family protein [Geminicoccaceae bacterium]
MRKVVSLFLPTWPTDRLRRSLGAGAPSRHEPLVLAAHDGRRRAIHAADAAARRLGLRPGLPLAEARARVPDLHVRDADPVADAGGLHRLALWCLRRYSPVVALDPPDGLWLDATGAGHLFGGDEAMLDDMIRRLARAGIRARAAMAGTTGAAHALARYVQDRRTVCLDRPETALAPLPLAALRLPPETVTELGQLGFERIEALERTSPSSLALRFGPEPGLRLDQAFGRRPEPLAPVVDPEIPHVERSFAEPISAPETLQRYTTLLVRRLCESLEDKALGARHLDLLFHRVDSVVQGLRIGTSAPSRDARHLAKILCEKLEGIDPGFGIERMVLSATLAEPFAHRQLAASDGSRREPELSTLVDTLANRLGPGRLYRIAPCESDLPERSVRRILPLAPATGRSWPQELPRPARLLDPPEPVMALAVMPDHPPVRFTWRGVQHRVARADGPERLHGEWWQPGEGTAALRDYFRIEDEAGQRFWLFREGDGVDPHGGSMRWYIHGLFA